MQIVVVTGAGGLIGAESVRFFCKQGFTVVGVDNNMRKEFFGDEASTAWSVAELKEQFPNYIHRDQDIRDFEAMSSLFKEYGSDIKLVIHTAAQPSHDWAARAPLVDFGVNANGTLNLLECTRLHCPAAVFIFTSTNKVYGDTPNRLPLVEQDTRWSVRPDHAYAEGIAEDMSIDFCTHSVFGASKCAADLMVQEYGRYFDMRTACFRGGCLTGPGHSGAELHGFLAYLMKCCVIGREYKVIGYKGKQVRDNIHSYDLIQAFYEFYKNPRVAEVYNIGGGRYSNVSMLEAISLCEEISGKKLKSQYVDQNRVGDHIWWIGDLGKFERHYPDWRITKNIRTTLEEIYEAAATRAH